jgi:hypothetical protein
MDALKKWTFKPVEVDGKPIAALGIAVRFCSGLMSQQIGEAYT